MSDDEIGQVTFIQRRHYRYRSGENGRIRQQHHAHHPPGGTANTVLQSQSRPSGQR